MANTRLTTVTLLLLALAGAGQAATEAEQAEAHFQAGEWQQAVAAYERLTRADDANGQYWFRLGTGHHNLEQYAEAAGAFTRALEHPGADAPLAATLLSLARAQAAAGDTEAALASLVAIADTEARPYLAASNAVEFASMADQPEFQAALNALKPCTGSDYRAFDFWLGEWEVTTPARAGWQASSSITLSNDGCSIQERYSTPSGYAGSSINFYDATRQVWHQTWVDNQGGPLYLDGGFANGTMVLSDDSNRITWSVQPDGRVRQHWESSSDEGKSWSTAFDGFYRRRAP